MPVKARRLKRRADNAASLAAWSVMFEYGRDYFLDLGFPNEAAALKAAPEAWGRLGHRFLDDRPETAARAMPWALETFGEP